jgi:hypothetical protein
MISHNIYVLLPTSGRRNAFQLPFGWLRAREVLTAAVTQVYLTNLNGK